MKSAFELAMERLEKEAPTRTLSEEQKREIADIDSACRAKIAERELFLKEQVAKAAASGEVNEIEALQKQLASEIRRITEDHETKKERVRNGR